MRAKIVCLGHAVLDRIYNVDAMPSEPVKVRASRCTEAGGGMAANAAVAIARLGGEVALWSRAGSDPAGGEIVAGLAREGVDAAHVRRFGGAVSSTSAILVDAAGERLIVNHRGEGLADDSAWLPLETVAGLDAVMADARWPEGAMALFAAARAAGVPTVLDADIGSAELLARILPLTDYCLFSQPGLAEWGGQFQDMALQRVHFLGVRHAGVTLGSRGYWWYDRDGQTHQKGFDVDAVDTTGAGDAFHGAFTLAIAERRPVAEAARFAAAVAALKCTRAGSRAGLPSRAEANAFLDARPRGGSLRPIGP